MRGYFDHIKIAISSMSEGLKLTFRYLFEARKSRKPIGIADETYFDVDQGIVTLQYPHESFPVPDNGRYRLHNEIDDCIVCDKCAKACPVDCIEIDAIKSPEVFGETSDGTPKRIHAAKFDIDMSKCCFCGLCTAVCPTECLTMTKAYDFSEFDVADHVYSFADMNLADIAQKRKDLEAHEIKKADEKARSAQIKAGAGLPKVGTKPVMKPKVAGAKPVMKPKIGVAKPVIKPEIAGSVSESSDKTTPVRPVMKPKVAGAKPVVKPRTTSSTSESSDKATPARPVMKPKPVIKPKMDTSSTSASKANDEPDSEAAKSKPKFRPRPMIPKKRKPKDGDE